MMNRALLLLLALVVASPSGLGWTWCGCATHKAACGKAQEPKARSCCGKTSAKAAETCCGKQGAPGPSLRDPSSCGCVRIEVPQGTSDDRTTRATVDGPSPTATVEPVVVFAGLRSPSFVRLAPRSTDRTPPPLQRALPLVI